jgi:hypothetical protein
MSETLTLNDTPADQPELNADEQESLAVAEANEGEQQQLLAGKFQDTQSLEQAYLALQKKLGEPREEQEAPVSEEVEEEPEDTEEEKESSEEKLSEAQATQLFEMIGGEQVYKDMMDWAGQSLSPEEIDMYDAVMAKGDPNSIFFAVQALNNKYSDAVGTEGQLLTGRTSASSANSAFRSQSELVAAMSDKRYDSDPAYRSDVMRKLENSDLEF